MTRRHWPALAWTLLVLVLCTLPGDPGGEPAPVLAMDKFWHAFAFAVFTVGWLWASVETRRVLAGALAFAVFLELWQAALPIARSGDVFDVVADVLGIAAGLGLWRLALRWRDPATA